MQDAAEFAFSCNPDLASCVWIKNRSRLTHSKTDSIGGSLLLFRDKSGTGDGVTAKTLDDAIHGGRESLILP